MVADTVIEFGNFVEMLPDAVVVVDDDDRIVFVNSAALTLFGYVATELSGHQLDILMPQRLRHAHRGHMTKYRQGGGVAKTMGTRPILRAVTKAGEEIAVSIAICTMTLARRRYAIAIIRDASAVREQLRNVSVAAYTDALTGTGNRLHLSRQLTKATAFPDKPFGLLFLDLEKFKQLNDRYGHEAGDEVLRVVAARLVAAARSDDVVARFGGDEFVLLLAGVDSNASLMSRAERIHERLVKPMRLQAGVGQIGVNIGGTLFPSGGSDERGLLAAADKAMYAAKRKGAWFGI